MLSIIVQLTLYDVYLLVLFFWAMGISFDTDSLVQILMCLEVGWLLYIIEIQQDF